MRFASGNTIGHERISDLSPMKNITSFCITLLVTVSLLLPKDVCAESPVPTPSIRMRSIVSEGDWSRLAAVMAQARRGEEIGVAAIVGSITAGGLQTKSP